MPAFPNSKRFSGCATDTGLFCDRGLSSFGHFHWKEAESSTKRGLLSRPDEIKDCPRLYFNLRSVQGLIYFEATGYLPLARTGHDFLGLKGDVVHNLCQSCEQLVASNQI